MKNIWSYGKKPASRFSHIVRLISRGGVDGYCQQREVSLIYLDGCATELFLYEKSVKFILKADFINRFLKPNCVKLCFQMAAETL